MIPVLLVPAALAALAAVLVPLAIHIARRTETRTIDFAALRWLTPKPKPVRRLQLDEPWLLAVRVALTAAIVLALARPVLNSAASDRPIVAVSPAVDATGMADRAERHVWLAPGFPDLKQPRPPLPDDQASLIRQLDAQTPAGTRLAVMVPALLTGVDGQRLVLSRPIDWRVLPSKPRSTSPSPPVPPSLTVRYSSRYEDAVRYFRAAAVAFAEPGKPPAFDAAPTVRPVPRSARYLVWLTDAPLPSVALAWIEAGGVVLLSKDTPTPVEGPLRVSWRDPEGNALATSGRFGKGRVLHLTRPVEPRELPALAEPAFAQELWTLLEPPPAPGRVAASDYAPAVQPMAKSMIHTPTALDLRPWLILLITSLFLLERWLATRRDRRIAA
ncbi:BatA domain-containing protein [Caulobacter henricii]|uniref:Aerotolerance regulator N-terminal domain-containing protein n=1 Tax=Caulobacter henricii TaxID=69395 RepID=A0A0P0P034_9CAUL|nr:BatA domain-containing protein [Caulobacter henricii]ALL13616.1 hypothetical protein AQ619_09775 [Caulobacter henricii]